MKNKIILVIAFLAMLFQVAQMQDFFQCYECGYMEDHLGRKSHLPSLVEDVPFCGNDTINKATTPKTNVTEVICISEIY